MPRSRHRPQTSRKAGDGESGRADACAAGRGEPAADGFTRAGALAPCALSSTGVVIVLLSGQRVAGEAHPWVPVTPADGRGGHGRIAREVGRESHGRTAAVPGPATLQT